MKVVRKTLNGDGGGLITMVPDEDEDMWHVYNLVAEGDQLRTITFRKVQKETASGGTESERIKLMLTIHVESIEFDSVSGQLRARGKNVEENPHVRLGSYHTLELERHRKFTLTKDLWDSMHLDTIKKACDPTSSADVAAVVMQEGFAHVCIITSSMTHVLQRVEQTVPRKGKAALFGHDKAVKAFYEKMFLAMRKHVDFAVIKCVILASPGWIKDEFLKYTLEESMRRDCTEVLQNKSKFLLCHASSGHKHALEEVLRDEGVGKRLADTKAAGEVRALDAFHTMLGEDETRAFYGPVHIRAAHELGAIDTLLITDELFRSSDHVARSEYVAMVKEVRDGGGKAFVFSSAHVSGEALKDLSGIAAIMRFPTPQLEELDCLGDDDDDSDDYDYEPYDSDDDAAPEPELHDDIFM